MSFSASKQPTNSKDSIESNETVKIERKEGTLIGYTDQNHAIISPNDGGNIILIHQPSLQIIHPNPPLSIYYLEVTITKSCGKGTHVIQRDIRKR